VALDRKGRLESADRVSLNLSARMDNLLQDIRFALRTLARRPVFTGVAIVTLALGIGANTALFSVIRSVLLRPLPYAEPDRVLTLYSSWVGWEKTWVSEPEILDYRDGAESLDAVGAYTVAAGNLTGAGQPERVTAGVVSADVFSVLGTPAALGRTFGRDEDRPGADGVAVLSHGLWQRRFAGDPAIVGRTIEYNGQPRTVVGVMPADFRLPEDYRSARPTELWIPLGINEADPNGRGGHYLFSVARLAPGFTIEQADADLASIVAGRVAEGVIAPEANFGAVLVPAAEDVLGPVRPTLFLLFGAVGLVLLIACANVANLLIAASEARRREIAVRAAIGAGRTRIARQLLTESLVLSILGGIAGVGLAAGASAVLIRLQPGNIPRLAEVQLDASVLVFALVIALLAGLVFGVGPSLFFSRLPLATGLREGGRTGTGGPGRGRFRRALIVGEIALSIVLVIGAGLMIRSVLELYRIDLGFRSDGVLTASLSPPASEYPDPEDVAGFFARLEERVATLPGVEEVGATRLLPLSGTIGDWDVLPEGGDPAQDSGPADWQVVTPGYVEAMGMELIRGRTIADTDRLDAMPVAMINEQMAEQYWPGEDALGKRFFVGNPANPAFTVVGVLRTVRHNEVTEEPRTEMYIPHQQFQLVNGTTPRAMTLTIRTAGDPMALAGAMREQARALDANVPVSDVRSLAEVESRALAQPRFAMILLASLAALALVLAAVGIYGVISYSVSERRKEMGIRMALGAESRRVMVMILGEGFKLALVGIGVGLGAAFLLTRLMSTLVYGVGTLDPLTFVLVPALLSVVALAAAWIPGWRATRIAPSAVLRD
jgi:putative ABC transport system permease protein